MQQPSLGRIVHYRGKQGLMTMRAAVITADVDNLDQRGVDAGMVPPLSSPNHVHLWVWTPASGGPNGVSGGFPEFDVPLGEEVDGCIPPGSWRWPPRV